jgi:malonyl-CoA O-methyltransferase
VFAEFHRVLRPGGLVHFTTFGPDTLHELRRAFAAVDDRSHVNHFADMHELGDGLVRAGFAEPVLDVDRHVLTYTDALALMRDLKAIGAHNVTSDRPRGLTGRRQLEAMQAAYERERRDGRLPATYEVVYGHAWRGIGGRRRRAGEPVAIPLAAIGRRAPDA